MGLEGRVAVVTGGASGIGRGICLALADEGAAVVVVDIERERAEDVAETLWKKGVRAEAMDCDVTNPKSVEALAERVFAEFDHVDILVNNAGVSVQGDLHTLSEGDWDWVMGVNLKAIYLTVESFVPKMMAQGDGGWILNTASEHAIGLPSLGRSPIYTASKHAVVGLSDVMRRDYAKKGIGVSVLCPGLVKTDIYDSARNRPKRFGAGERITPAVGEKFMEEGMAPEAVGRIAVDGMRDGDFFIITHSHIREYVEQRAHQLASALDKADLREEQALQEAEASKKKPIFVLAE